MDRTAQDIATRALTLDGAEREAFLDSRCERDPALRRAVEALLSVQGSATLDSTDRSGVMRGFSIPGEPARGGIEAGQMLDDFRIIRPIGHGAMGVVYLAEQQNPVRRVALKVLRHETLTETRAERFRFETESLAKLRHPSIATIYKSGSAELLGSRVPFFAMELVDGESLDRHANYADLVRRVELMVSVCDAVAHAHARGIVHRDLKPANILVDSSGRPRVLDFGVAMSMEAGESRSELVGTLPYMSPEQLEQRAEIGPAADVFALGVILCEVLTGRRPFLTGAKTVGEVRESVGGPPAIDRDTTGRELEAVIRRAVAEDPSDRYGGAGELRDELRRFLDRRPVEAMGGGRGYVARKFVSRNRALAAVSAAALALAVGGFAGVAYQAARATSGWRAAEEQGRLTEIALADAQAQQRRARTINQFMVNMLTSADPESTLGEELTVLDMLDTAAGSLEEGLPEQPEVAAGIRMAFANTYRSLGRLDDALYHAERMVEVCESGLGADHELTGDARRTLALVLYDFGRFERAKGLLESAEPLVSDPVERVKLKSEFARVAHGQGDSEEALRLWTDAEVELTGLLGPDHLETLIVQHNLAMALKELGRLDESRARMALLLENRTRVFGKDHPQTLVALDSLAGIIQKQGREREAADMLRRAVEGRAKVLGEDHISTLVSKGNLGATLIRLGELEEAERLTRAAFEGHRERFGESHTRTLILMGNLAYLLEDLGQVTDAAAMYRRSIEIRRGSEGSMDPETWSTMNNLAMLLLNNGEPGEARAWFEELLGYCDAYLPAGHYYTALFRNNYAECLIVLGENDAAREALDASHPVIEATFGPDHARTKKSRGRYEMLGSGAG